ncbi:MAG: hypothetical protein B6V02_02095 [Thermoprotei archaeon ex4572_64]|nr:MAG: hypothetical protein B6V02_02095 [Thermoprotei archaeon ex4572_64]
MTITTQRSIPIPRVKIDRLIKYLMYLSEKGEVNVKELKDSNLDFGRGRGDITRFYKMIQIVEIHEDKVRLTRSGKMLCRYLSTNTLLGYRVFHRILYNKIIPYRLMIDLVCKHGSTSEHELYLMVNEELSKISPSSWINNVAYKTLLGLALDLKVIERRGKEVLCSVTSNYEEIFRKCLLGASVDMLGRYVISISEFLKCVEAEGLKISMKNIQNLASIEPLITPKLSSNSVEYIIINDLDLFIRELLKVLEEISDKLGDDCGNV